MVNMTNEEAKKILNIIPLTDCNGKVKPSWVIAVGTAIKALDQMSALDKIRAEIIELRSRQNVGVLECLDIIDKYRAESEDK